MAISYNEPITFGRQGTAKGMNCAGIDFSEEGSYSWTTSSVAELDIQLPLVRQEVTLQLDATPFIVQDAVAAQNMFIFMGGLFVGYRTVTAPEVVSILVNRSIIAGRLMRLSLVIPTAVSPYTLGMSEDRRDLGICLSFILFKTA
jgi:hypothetical protein